MSLSEIVVAVARAGFGPLVAGGGCPLCGQNQSAVYRMILLRSKYSEFTAKLTFQLNKPNPRDQPAPRGVPALQRFLHQPRRPCFTGFTRSRSGLRTMLARSLITASPASYCAIMARRWLSSPRLGAIGDSPDPANPATPDRFSSCLGSKLSGHSAPRYGPLQRRRLQRTPVWTQRKAVQCLS
jgi:hypothetical protein